MKIVKVKPLDFKVEDKVIDALLNNTQTAPNRDIIEKNGKEIIKLSKSRKPVDLVTINPDSKELLCCLQIIENKKLFAAQFPNPIQLYYSLAFANYQYAQKLRHIITFQGDISTGNLVDGYVSNWYLQCKISTIIFLHSTVEAFINYLMPENFIYKKQYNEKEPDKFIEQGAEYNKEQTEKYIQFKEKLSEVVTQLTNIDFQRNHKKIYDKLLNLNTLRNNIIHLRSTKDNNRQYFETVFNEVINIDLASFVNSVRDFINIIKPDFIEFEETRKSEEPFELNFKEGWHETFIPNISVFIKILDTPAKKIRLNISKGTNEKFQLGIDWIMQNLNILVKEQLIYFPTVNENFVDKIVIEFYKTDRQLGSKPS